VRKKGGINRTENAESLGGRKKLACSLNVKEEKGGSKPGQMKSRRKGGGGKTSYIAKGEKIEKEGR